MSLVSVLFVAVLTTFFLLKFFSLLVPTCSSTQETCCKYWSITGKNSSQLHCSLLTIQNSLSQVDFPPHAYWKIAHRGQLVKWGRTIFIVIMRLVVQNLKVCCHFLDGIAIFLNRWKYISPSNQCTWVNSTHLSGLHLTNVLVVQCGWGTYIND